MEGRSNWSIWGQRILKKMSMISKEKCCGCKTCVYVCPSKCISMVSDEEGFTYPAVDEEACTHCGACERACPFHGGNKREKDVRSTAYAAKSRSEEIQLSSSSGGMFYELSKAVLRNGGTVYGAVFDEVTKKIVHIHVDDIENLSKLKGSKYVQSDIGESYNEAKRDLKDDRWVLFSGTPCQIAGLRNYLKADYERLICVDVVCHGVPSPLLWERYVYYLEREYGSQIETVNFRCKERGWRDFAFGSKLGSKSFYQSKDINPYMQMFLHNYCLRPSCYGCEIKQIMSVADITMGDFWGVEKVCPEMNDKNGVSLIIVWNAKGKWLIDEVEDSVIFKEVDFQQAIRFNTPLYKSVDRPSYRDSFYIDLETRPFDEMIDKYGKAGFSDKLGILKRNIVARLRGGVEG